MSTPGEKQEHVRQGKGEPAAPPLPRNPPGWAPTVGAHSFLQIPDRACTASGYSLSFLSSLSFPPFLKGLQTMKPFSSFLAITIVL